VATIDHPHPRDHTPGVHSDDSKRAVWAAVTASISRYAGTTCRVGDRMPVGGGCISSAWAVETSCGPFFIKLQSGHTPHDFAAEATGLAALAASGAVRVPTVVGHDVAAGTGWLVLEQITLRPRDADCDALLGRALASLHASTAPRFGFTTDNLIGATIQPNGWRDDWIGFWREHRLGHQLMLATRNGHRIRYGEQLLGRLDALLAGHRPVASLLHGDLWAGNAAADESGAPVLYDPAVYYGDREADLAMAALFGGFDDRFEAAYREVWPLDDGYHRRRDLYNLYHVLNHLNLFGGGYAAQAARLIDRLLGGG